MRNSFQKFGISNLANGNQIKSILNRFGPAYYAIYQSRSFSNLYKNVNLVEFIKLSDSLDIDLEKFKRTKNYANSLKGAFGIKNKEVIKVSNNDIDIDSHDIFGAITLLSKDDITIRYGERGLEPSSGILPIDLLKKSLIIPANSFGVLHVQRHVPFLIDANIETTIMESGDQFKKVLTFEENINKFSLLLLADLPHPVSKVISINLQKRIYEDEKKERFYEEMTSKVFLPDKSMDNSGTLMNFDYADEDIEKRTDHHYHPGDRVLLISSGNRESGVILNFCGVNENPKDRKDCEVKLNFKKNSLSILRFPAFTHHKFTGDFVCLSVHPKEGKNIIEAVQSGTLPKGFLESATVFSGKENQPWNILDKDSTKNNEKKSNDVGR